MLIFLDSANIEEIQQANDWGVISGVTTNPSLIAKEGRNFEQVVREIAAIVDGPISAEVISLDSEQMVKEAETLARIHPNIVIKIPITPEGLKATKILSRQNKVNMTLPFPQPSSFGRQSRSGFCQSIIGRLDDINQDGMGLIEELLSFSETLIWIPKLLRPVSGTLYM